MRICKIKKCSNSAMYKNGGRKGYCCRHYSQLLCYGRILKRTRSDKNKIVDCKNHYEICLYNIKHKEVARTKIDKEDLDKIKNYKWYLNKQKYVHSNKSNSFLHQLILGKKEGFEIDHINHDKSDNRKQNLRHCTRGQNNMNRINTYGISGTTGVTWDKYNQKWRSEISLNYKTINLGRYKEKKTAIKARRQAEQKYFGEFAYNQII